MTTLLRLVRLSQRQIDGTLFCWRARSRLLRPVEIPAPNPRAGEPAPPVVLYRRRLLGGVSNAHTKAGAT